MRDSLIPSTLGPQAQQRADDVGQPRTPNAYEAGDGAQTWLNASLIAVAVFGVSEQLQCWPQSGWDFIVERPRPHRIGFARLSSVLVVGGRAQCKSQVWLKACNRRDEAGDMVRALGAKPRRSRRRPSALMEARV